ncbi:hypothetical protein [Hymenobacter cheonanensis]|uniref:hypothetical protein n=1 Tax=Hymenobacter sp. CA2-7 TaxID=3063993 RepID=UPI0027130CB3|nr:hypothetical protein [Hymenobacter sp. CA2-7]MDO7888175.1 hypothetical protein [Hymenobacter sp. CA2-7]
MKKAYALTLLAIAACSSTPTTQYSFALDQRVSARLPFKPYLVEARDLPQVAHAGRVQVWRLFTNGGDYELTRTVHPAGSFSARDTAFYAKLIPLLKRAGAHDITSRPFAVNGIAGREFTYYTVHSTPTYIRCFALDSVSYGAAFFPARQLGLLSLSNNKRRDDFFNSITVKP